MRLLLPAGIQYCLGGVDWKLIKPITYTKYVFEELNIESVMICMYPFDSNSMQTGLIRQPIPQFMHLLQS